MPTPQLIDHELVVTSSWLQITISCDHGVFVVVEGNRARKGVDGWPGPPGRTGWWTLASEGRPRVGSFESPISTPKVSFGKRDLTN